MNNPQRKLCLAFTLLLAFMPLSAVVAPRGLAFLPGITGLVYLLMAFLTFREKPVIPRTALIGVAVISILCIVSSMWAIIPPDALGRALRTTAVLCSGCLLLSAAQTIRLENLKPYLWIFPASLILTATLIFIELKLDSQIFRFIRNLPPEHDVYPAEYNRASVFVILMLFPAVSILRHYIDYRKILILLAFDLGPLLIVADSQSTQMAFLLGMITLIAFPYRHKFSWVTFCAVVFGLMLAAPFISIWVFKNMATSIEAIPLLGKTGGFAGARLEIWDYVSRYMLQNPLYGFGLEATRHINNFDSKQIYQEGTSILHPHNFVLQIWIEFGLVGIVTLGGLLTALILRMQKYLTPQQARFTLPTLIAIMSVGSTGYGMWQGWWIGTLFVAIATCILAVRMDNENTKGID